MSVLFYYMWFIVMAVIYDNSITTCQHVQVAMNNIWHGSHIIIELYASYICVYICVYSYVSICVYMCVCV